MSSGQNEKGSKERKKSGVKEAKVNFGQTWKLQNLRYVIMSVSCIVFSLQYSFEL